MPALTLAEIVDPRLSVCEPGCALAQAAALMAEQRGSSLLVMLDGVPLGMVTERDILLAAHSRLGGDRPVSTVMSSPVLRAPHDMRFNDAYLYASRHRVRHLMVVDDDGRLLGTVSESDFRHHLNLEVLRRLNTVEALMDRGVPSLGVGDTLDLALTRMREAGATCVMVLDGGRPLGILTLRDVARLFGGGAGESEMPLGAVMTAPVRTIGQTAPALEAAHSMRSLDIRHLAVVDTDGLYRGTLSEHDLLRPLELEDLDRLLDERETMAISLDELQAVAGLGSWSLDLASRQHVLSRQAYHLLGLPTDTPATPEDFLACLHPDDRERAQAAWEAALAGAPLDLEIRILRGGAVCWLHVRAHIHRDWDGRPLRAVGTVQDITERKRADERLQLAASVFEHAHEGILITDPQQRIVEVNKTFCELTGYNREEVLGNTPRMLGSGHHPPEFYRRMWGELQASGHWQGEVWNRRKNGELFAELLTISAVRSSDGEVVNYLGLFSDITLIKEHQKQLERMAHYDALTQLPNRVLLSDRLEQAMPQSRRNGKPLAVCYLDLDGFKLINDSLGHAAGDRLLLEVSQRLKNCLRASDTVARLGGDEFVILLREQQSQAEVMHTLTRILAILSTPYAMAGQDVHLSASIGVTLYPHDESDADTLIRHADQAMYAAKLAGRNRYHLFDPVQDRRTIANREALSRIRRGLQAGEFVLYYQPKVDMRRGEVLGMEALIRWQHPEMGLLPPAEFLGIVEESDLSMEMGDWVLETALRQAEQWRAQGLELSVSINISARHLQQRGFLGRLREHLAAHPRLATHQVELEILESVALDDTDRVSRVIEDCHKLGVRIALDDFGTGYASLTYFRRLPVDTLKVDQSFVRDMLEDEDDYAIVEGVVGLTQAFRRQVVAEGVETSQHGMVLLRLGCDLAQGYGIARPMPAERVPEWVAGFKPDPLWHTGLSYGFGREDIPLMLAEHNHRAWLDAVAAYVRGEGPTLGQPLCDDHLSCAFGRWYYGSGQLRYGDYPEFLSLEEIHQQVHEAAAELCQLKHLGRREEAVAGLPALMTFKSRILEALAALVSAATERTTSA